MPVSQGPASVADPAPREWSVSSVVSGRVAWNRSVLVRMLGSEVHLLFQSSPAQPEMKLDWFELASVKGGGGVVSTVGSLWVGPEGQESALEKKGRLRDGQGHALGQSSSKVNMSASS
jgi:hypothetical protein